MGAAITTLFTNLASQATMPARAIATAIIIGIGLTLTMMPWEHGAVRFLKDSALRVAVGLAIVPTPRRSSPPWQAEVRNWWSIR